MATTKEEFLDKTPEQDYTLKPYDAWWFYPIDGGRMERIDLFAFYHLGKALGTLRRVNFEDAGADEAWIGLTSLQNFHDAAKDLTFPLAKAEALKLKTWLDKIIDSRVIERSWLEKVKKGILDFEHVFKREAGRVSAFSVTPKGIYDIEKLISEGEKKFSADLVAVMPQSVIDDIQEASRCLAFERGTACAFHICRAAEGLMRAYYKKLTGNEWPPPPPKPKMSKDWKVLVDQLAVEGAPKKIIERLGELRDDRNSYAHPDVTVPVDEAPIVYETCTFAMFYIAKEMV